MHAIFFTYNCSRPSRIFVSFGVIQINPIQNSQIDQQKKLKAPASRKRGGGRGGKHLRSKRARDLQDAVNARKQKLQVYDIYKFYNLCQNIWIPHKLTLNSVSPFHLSKFGPLVIFLIIKRRKNYFDVY